MLIGRSFGNCVLADRHAGERDSPHLCLPLVVGLRPSIVCAWFGCICALTLRAMKTVNGFTLIELMVSVAILAILLGIGIPSMQVMIQNNRITSAANDFLGALGAARSEAIKRGINVRMTALGSFDLGWCVHVNATPPACAGDEANILHRHGAMEPSVVVVSVSNEFVFDRLGALAEPVLAGGASVTVDLSPNDCVADEDRMRRVTIQNTGRASISREDC